jgi:hypothetical protein
VAAAGASLPAWSGGDRGVEGIVTSWKGIRKMSVENKYRQVFLVLVALALIARGTANASDETTFREETTQVTITPNKVYVRRILASPMSAEQKVQELRGILRLGMSIQELEKLIGEPFLTCHDFPGRVTDAAYEPVPGELLRVYYDRFEKASSVCLYSDNRILVITSKERR